VLYLLLVTAHGFHVKATGGLGRSGVSDCGGLVTEAYGATLKGIFEGDGARKYKRKAGADGEEEVVLWPRRKLGNKVGVPVIFDHCTRTPDYTCECLFAIRTKIGLEAPKCLFQVRTNGRRARQMLHQVSGHWRPSDHIPVPWNP
jgi:hypothetical protein